MSPGLLRDTGVRLAAAVLAWLAGIALQLQQPALWPTAFYLGLLVLALPLGLAWRRLASGTSTAVVS